jgi:hypothetical protein
MSLMSVAAHRAVRLKQPMPFSVLKERQPQRPPNAESAAKRVARKLALAYRPPSRGAVAPLAHQAANSSEAVVYLSLLRATWYEGECPVCGNYPNRKTVVQTVDMGVRTVYRCEDCRKYLRPYERLIA